MEVTIDQLTDLLAAGWSKPDEDDCNCWYEVTSDEVHPDVIKAVNEAVLAMRRAEWLLDEKHNVA